MLFGPWLKKRLPKSLFGRSILILAIPILLIQAVVSYIFIDRLYGDVTIAKTTDVAREINYVLSQAEDSSLQAMQNIAQHLALTVVPQSAPDAEDKLEFVDISGRFIIQVLRESVAGIDHIDLATNDRLVKLYLTHDDKPFSISFARNRASAVNPHQLLVAGALASFLFIGIAVLFLRNQVKPIKLLARSAEAFGKGDKVKFSPSGAAEVRQAGHAFISMQARIERHLEQRTAILSGVSHDLRTPLTRMKLSLSLMDQEEGLDDLQGDVAEMERIVNEFLSFTRGDSGEDLQIIDPKTFIKAMARGQRRADHAVDLKFTGLQTERVDLKCRKQALSRAIDNLLSNAARYGDNTMMTLDVSPTHVSFIVEDDGPGIPKAEREDALKPFERLDASRNQNKGSGTGLGLAIATDITRSHGGQIHLGHSTAMGGLKAEIKLPR